METLLDQEKISDTITVGAEFEPTEGEVVVYFATPEMSSSMALEEEEWEKFMESIEEIDRKLDF